MFGCWDLVAPDRRAAGQDVAPLRYRVLDFRLTSEDLPVIFKGLVQRVPDGKNRDPWVPDALPELPGARGAFFSLWEAAVVAWGLLRTM